MKQITLPTPELGLIAATRGALGAGIGLLAADKLTAKQRKRLGMVLLGIGIASTIPLILDVMKRNSQAEGEPISKRK